MNPLLRAALAALLLFALPLAAQAQTKTSDVFQPLLDGMWWTPDEPGSGLMLKEARHEAGIVFANWLTFDRNGEPTWYVMSRGVRSGLTVEGEVYWPSGPRMNGPYFSSFDKTQFVPGAPVGRFRIEFALNGTAAFHVDIDGVSATKAIRRLEVRDDNGALCTTAREVWYSPNAPGWALSTEGGFGSETSTCRLHSTLAIYNSEGRPTWYFAPLAFSGYDTLSWPYYQPAFSGPAYRVTGSYFGGAYDASKLKVTQVGTFRATTPVGGPPLPRLALGNYVLAPFDF